MIHPVILPPATKHALLGVMHVQIALLNYAAKCPTPADFNQPSCVRSLRHARGVGSRAAEVAAWLFSKPKMCDPLRAFAHHPDVREKQSYVRRYIKDMEVLAYNLGLRRPLKTNYVAPKLPTGGAPPPGWREWCDQFLGWFYTPLAKLNANPFPACVTGTAAPFGREQFLQEYMDANKDYTVCPMCDEFDFRTYNIARVVVEVDHYFPKTIFPHLSAHPYNLVPICEICNGTQVKKDKDPLRGSTKRLSDVRLPYRAPAFRDEAFVKFQPPGGRALDLWARAGTLTVPAPPLDTHDWLFRIPTRWALRPQIENELLQRTVEWLSVQRHVAIDAPELLQLLHRFVGQLYRYEVGRVPRAFALAWYVADQARQLADQIQQVRAGATTALLRAVNARFGGNSTDWPTLESEGERLRAQIR